MNLPGKVRRLYYRDRLTLSEVERRTGLTRKTVRKWLNTPEGVEPKYRRRSVDSKIAPYAERLLKMLEIDAGRPKRERRTALKLYAELSVTGFCRRLQPRHRIYQALAGSRPAADTPPPASGRSPDSGCANGPAPVP